MRKVRSRRKPCQGDFLYCRVDRSTIRNIQNRLLKWWQIEKRDFPWRRPNASIYHRIVCELLLQRTKAENIAAFWPTFISLCPSWKKIAMTPISQIETILRPIGLSKQRAPRLHSLAMIMAKRHGRFPKSIEEINALPGVGQYIANAICLFAHSQAAPLLDVNMARVLERCFGPRTFADIRYDPYLQKLAKQISAGAKSVQINWAILDLAAAICRSREPDCSSCPLKENCQFGKRLGQAIDEEPSPVC
jgi:A/G-specific adenine glycosylase